MEDLKILFAYFKEHKKGILIIIMAAITGTAFRVAAFRNGWLG